MACSKCSGGGQSGPSCGQNTNNAYNYFFIVLILYILLAIIIGGSLLY